MGSKHTPGPWRIDDPRFTNPPEIWVAADHAPEDDKLPAMCRASNRDTAIANARLVSAAPDLLAACKLISDSTEAEITLGQLKAVRKAIAKAEGK